MKIIYRNYSVGGWRVGSAVKSTAALPEDPDLVASTHTAAHDHLQQVPGDSMPSSALCRYHEYTWYTYIHVSKNVYTYKGKTNKSLKFYDLNI